MQGGSLLALPALPGAYFFESTIGIGSAMIVLAAFISIASFMPFVALPALAQTHIQRPHPSNDIEIRANRLLSLLLAFVIIALIFGLLVMALAPWLNFTGAPAIVGTLTAVTSGLLTIFAYPAFQRLVDHKILGIPLIRDELLPSLLVRGSALLSVENQNLEPIYLMNVEDAQLSEDAELPKLIDQAGAYRPPGNESPSPWIRLILPLTVGGELRGLWLLGRRDPDDYYASRRNRCAQKYR